MANSMKLALLKAIIGLDDEGVTAVYNALAAHIENEQEHVELLLDSSISEDAEEGRRAERALKGVQAVVESYETALCALAG